MTPLPNRRDRRFDKQSRAVSDNFVNALRRTWRGLDSTLPTLENATQLELDAAVRDAGRHDAKLPDAEPTSGTGRDITERNDWERELDNTTDATDATTLERDATELELDATRRNQQLNNANGLTRILLDATSPAGERNNATTLLDTKGVTRGALRNAPDFTDATNATDADATDADATQLETLPTKVAASSPVEPTPPAVRTQRKPIICLGDLLETVVLEISLTTRSLRCRYSFAGVSFNLCSANKGELTRLLWRECVARRQKRKASTGCVLTPKYSANYRRANDRPNMR